MKNWRDSWDSWDTFATMEDAKEVAKELRRLGHRTKIVEETNEYSFGKLTFYELYYR